MRVDRVGMRNSLAIGQLARRTGLTVHTLRYWSDSGLLVPSGRPAGGYRLFDGAAVARLTSVARCDDDEAHRLVDRMAKVSAAARGAAVRLVRRGAARPWAARHRCACGITAAQRQRTAAPATPAATVRPPPGTVLPEGGRPRFGRKPRAARHEATRSPAGSHAQPGRKPRAAWQEAAAVRHEAAPLSALITPPIGESAAPAHSPTWIPVSPRKRHPHAGRRGRRRTGRKRRPGLLPALGSPHRACRG
ncbi:MerR family DNA-binding transcriptional regulator [Actinoplanes sp. NPDC024001]|uniref:helix-turn-helix domain-containing protein n=1 Tax=Actinoplanes sp. NPDC024001 TaxID=3154598 RepID=UPI0033F5D9C7